MNQPELAHRPLSRTFGGRTPRASRTTSAALRLGVALCLALASTTGSVVSAQAPVEATTGPAAPEETTSETTDSASEPAEVDPASAALAGVADPVDAAPAPAIEPAAPAEPNARLDYSDGSFYLRSIHDNLVLVPGARMHIDTYGFAGRGVRNYARPNGSGLSTNLFFRRFVIEMGGMVRHKWFFWFGGNFAPTTIDAGQAVVSSANVYDGFIGYLPNPHTRIYVGQFNAPFTMENTTSSRWLDLMERALSVRTMATPYNKADGVMVWGNTENRSFEYQAGVFGGDGMNRPSVDNRVDAMGRFVFRPLATRTDALARFHIGIGGRIGSRDRQFVRYDTPGLSTPGGYTFWSSSYTDSTLGKIHIRQSGMQAAMSGEFYLPFERFDLRGEIVYLHENRAEVTDANVAVRSGAFTGVGAYGQASIWLAGTPRINGNPAGVYGMTRIPEGPGAQARFGLQLVARAEIVRAAYRGNSRAGADAGGRSGATSNIDVNVYQVGLNYWATKHIRVTGEYSLYNFPGSGASNQARAPGVAAGAADANTLHEFSVRLGLAL